MNAKNETKTYQIARVDVDEAKRCGFSQDGTGTWVRETKLNVTIVERVRRHGQTDFEVYVFHGHPGGQFWKNGPGLVKVKTLAAAHEIAATLYGFAGSGRLAFHVVSISLW